MRANNGGDIFIHIQVIDPHLLIGLLWRSNKTATIGK